VNINYELPEDLHRALKIRAAEKGITLKDLILEYLQAGLVDESIRSRREKVRLYES
jgi:plasmid stability protein